MSTLTTAAVDFEAWMPAAVLLMCLPQPFFVTLLFVLPDLLGTFFPLGQDREVFSPKPVRIAVVSVCFAPKECFVMVYGVTKVIAGLV